MNCLEIQCFLALCGLLLSNFKLVLSGSVDPVTCDVLCDPGTLARYSRVIVAVNGGEGYCQTYKTDFCIPCPEPLQPGYYWTSVKTAQQAFCQQVACATSSPGTYFVSRCSENTNAVVNPCSKFGGNAFATSIATASYYCPGSGLPVSVPDNGRVKDETYTDFTCNDGFYKSNSACQACNAGSYCVNGEKKNCPQHYFTDKEAQSFCRRCTTPSDCQSIVCSQTIADKFSNPSCGVAPRVCAPPNPACMSGGCTQNSDCIACGSCGDWPETGINCVLGDEMNFLPVRYP
jgi:hypothetical protein